MKKKYTAPEIKTAVFASAVEVSASDGAALTERALKSKSVTNVERSSLSAFQFVN